MAIVAEVGAVAHGAHTLALSEGRIAVRVCPIGAVVEIGVGDGFGLSVAGTANGFTPAEVFGMTLGEGDDADGGAPRREEDHEKEKGREPPRPGGNVSHLAHVVVSYRPYP
jgi:hypothetical protein